MSANAGPNIVEDGLIFMFDPNDPKSNPLDDNFYDRSINQKAGYGVGAPATDGNIMTFDGTDYIRFNDISELQFTSADDFTISAWVKPTVDGQTFKGIFGNSAYNNGGWQLSLLNGSYYFLIGGPTTSYPYLGTDNHGEWSNIVMTYESTDLRGYINNNPTTTYTRHITTNSNPIFIGNGTQGGWGTFTGEVGPCIVHNKVLTEEERLQNYNATKSRFGL